MDSDSFLQQLKLLYAGTVLPVRYLEDGICRFEAPQIDGPAPIEELRIQRILAEPAVGYRRTKSQLYFGWVHDPDGHRLVVAGPVSTNTVSPDAIHELMTQYAIGGSSRPAIEQFFSLTPSFSVHQFLHLLLLIHSLMNGEFLEVETYFHYRENITGNELKQETVNDLYQSKEDGIRQNSWQMEQLLFSCVERGDPETARKIMSQSYHVDSGTMGRAPLRQGQNVFIGVMTLVTRSAIRGGMDISEAYQLSDTYIMESERAVSQETIDALTYTAIMDFAQRVAAAQLPSGMSADVYRCLQYVSQNTNRHISVEDVAEEVGKSASYLSKKFYKELGFHLSSYILRRKLEEGKSLLSYSDRSISEISEYLCFSSQAHFQNSFKKQFGITPNEWRRKARI